MNRCYVKAQLFIFPVEDSVYLPNDELLQEYILNENGILYQGSWDDITTVPWNFGQVYTCIHIRSNEASVLKCLWSATSLRKCCDLRWHMVIQAVLHAGGIPMRQRVNCDRLVARKPQKACLLGNLCKCQAFVTQMALSQSQTRVCWQSDSDHVHKKSIKIWHNNLY